MKSLDDLREEARGTWQRLMNEKPDVFTEKGWQNWHV